MSRVFVGLQNALEKPLSIKLGYLLFNIIVISKVKNTIANNPNKVTAIKKPTFTDCPIFNPPVVSVAGTLPGSTSSPLHSSSLVV